MGSKYVSTGVDPIFIDSVIGKDKNPSIDAYMMAKYLPINGKLHDNLRVLSLSANDQNANRTAFINMDKLSQFIFYKEWREKEQTYSRSQDVFLNWELNQDKNNQNYLRISNERDKFEGVKNAY